MVLDTNIIIALAGGDERLAAFVREQAEERIISRISVIEFLADKTMTPTERRNAAALLRDTFRILDVTEPIGDLAVHFRIEHPSLKLPDTLILATATHERQRLITFDRRLKTAAPDMVVVPPMR